MIFSDFQLFFHPFLSAENDTRPDKLRAVSVKIVNYETCEKNYVTDRVKFKVTKQMICAGWAEGVKDACSGDSVS
jgi:secreted trypsin-like serine protease